jgi:peptide/nickel transport system substrate-binding protein
LRNHLLQTQGLPRERFSPMLESGQTEIDPARRRAIYDRFQQQVQTDVARIPLISPHVVTLARREVIGFGGNQGLYANFADVGLAGRVG